MKYLVIEIQKTDDTVATLVNSFDTINEAESKYHTVLAYAAVSSVHVHTAVLMNETGYVIKHESYDHTPEAEEETESEE